MIHIQTILFTFLLGLINLVSAQSFASSNSSTTSSFSSSETSSFIIPSSSSSSSIFVAPSSSSSSSSLFSSFNLFTSTLNTNTSSFVVPTTSILSTSTSSSSSITPIFTSSNISTLPITSTSTSSSSTSTSSLSTSTSSSSISSTTSFSSTSAQPTTSKSLSTYTSDGQVMVTQVFLTLTSTHTSFSTKPGKHHGLSSKNKKIVAGVVVGVGVPVIILIIWLVYFFMLKGKKERYIDSQGREVIDIKHNKFVRYVWCDLFGFTFKDDGDQSVYNKSTSSFRNSNNFMNRGGSKGSSNYNNSNLGVLGNNVMQMNDMRLEKENALLKEQREKGFPTNDNLDDKDHMDSSNSPVSFQDDHSNGRDIDGNFKGRNSMNTHRRIESVVSGDGFDYLDEINAKKY